MLPYVRSEVRIGEENILFNLGSFDAIHLISTPRRDNGDIKETHNLDP